MPRFEITAPDGARYQVNGPDGATEQDALAQVQKQVGMQPPPTAEAKPDPETMPGGQFYAPDAQSTDQSASHSQDFSSRVHDALAPAPNTTYGDVLPLAKDDTTGAIRPALPNMIRSPLIGLTQEGGQATIDPGTGTIGVPPEAAAVTQFAATPLRFGGAGLAGGAAVASPKVTAREVQVRDDVGIMEAWQRAHAENRAAAEPPAAAIADIGKAPDIDSAIAAAGRAVAEPPGEAIPTVTVTAARAPEAMPEPVGAAASREGTPAEQLAIDPQEAMANRQQGEIERLAAPPTIGDKNIYIPGTEVSLAEITGDPAVAMEHQYNRQQPAAAPHHTAREDRNAALVANYYADTAGSAQSLLRMERERETRAAQNIRQVFGDPRAERPTAEPFPTLELMEHIRTDPRQAERNSVTKVISALNDKFYNADGSLKTDPYALYGIGEHINDLLRGTGDTETSSAARVLKRELTQIKESLYNDIEDAAPGFAKYRNDYRADSQAIDAMKLLQDERLSLLGGGQTITPVRWLRFMNEILKGRSDPMDAASALSEAQMDRLWNITDQLKRQTLQDKGKPRGSWTSLMQELGIRSLGRLAGHVASLATIPTHFGTANIAVELMNSKLRERNVMREMNRLLRPDLGQGPLP